VKRSLRVVVILLLVIASHAFAEERKEAEFLRQGAAYFEAQDYQKAARSFREAVDVNPGSAEAHRALGMAYFKLGAGEASTNVELVDKAIAEWREAVRIAPDLAQTRYLIGLACLLLGDREGALEQHKALAGLNQELARQLNVKIAAFRPPKSFQTLITQPDGERKLATRVTIAGNAVLVPVTLSHGDRTVQASMLLDTGASVTVLTREMALRLGLDLDEARKTRMQVADGRSVPTWHIRLDRVSVGSKSKTGVDVVVVQESGGKFPFDGLLGMNFLRSFKYSIDFSNQIINWSR